MKLFKILKDGGPESHCTGFFLIEIKKAFSIVLLHFSDGSRDAFHSHAFNAVSWLPRGKLVETLMDGTVVEYTPSLKPISTPRSRFHKVVSIGDSWALSFRGPWVDRWKEYIPKDEAFLTLTHGRDIVESKNTK